MKNFKLLLFTVFVATLSLAACSDDDNNNVEVNKNTEKIVGKFTLDKIIYEEEGQAPVTQLYSENTTGCTKNHYEFLSGGTGFMVTYTSPEAVCVETKTPVTYSLTANNSYIEIGPGEYSIEGSIDVLNDTELRIRDSYQDETGTDYRDTYYFTRLP